MNYRSLLMALALTLPAPLLLAQQDSPASPAADTMPMPMQQRMEEMHAQMQRIIETEDPAERRRLWEEHRQQMEEHMAMMREHGGPGGGGMHGGGHGNRHGGGAGGGMHAQHWSMLAFEEMSKRLDLMQTLMESQLLGEE